MLSALLPGLGQLVARRWRRAWALVAAAALLGLLGWWLRPAPEVLLSLVVRPEARPWLHASNGLLLLLRLGAAVDAYLITVRPPAIPLVPRTATAMVGTAAALTLVLAAVALPHAALGYTVQRTGEVLDQVLVAEAAGAVPQDGQQAPGRPSTDPAPSRTDPAPTRTDPARTPTSPAALPQAPANPWQENERLTVAVLGSDAGPGRVGARLDALLVASLDTSTGAAALFSVDRYLAGFPVPEHLDELYHANCTEGEGWRYLNALYTCGVERIDTELAALYPDSADPAAQAVTDTLAELLDLQIDHHALVDMAGFVAVVDALGGIELELEQPLRVRMSPAQQGSPWRTVDLPSGRQQLDGEQALAYARVRGAGGDAARMQRQRCLVAGSLAAADLPGLLRGFPALATAVEQHLVTDVATTELPQLLRLLLEIELGPVVAEGFGPPGYRGADHAPDVTAIRERTAVLLEGAAGPGDIEVVGAQVTCP